MKIAMIQLKVGFDKEENIKKALDKIWKAYAQGIDMAVLPEMFCCPYSNKYFREYGEEHFGVAQKALSDIAKELGIYVIGGSIPELSGGNVYNTSFVYDDDGVEIAKHRKVHLFDIDIQGGQRFFESETLTAGEQITTFETRFGLMGLCICFDFRFQEMSQIMTERGAKVVFVPASFNMTTGPLHWETMFRQRAVDNQIFTIGVSQARDTEFEYVSYGNSIAVSPWGEVLAKCAGEECIQFVNIDLSLIDKVRNELPIRYARRTDLFQVKEL